MFDASGPINISCAAAKFNLDSFGLQLSPIATKTPLVHTLSQLQFIGSYLNPTPALIKSKNEPLTKNNQLCLKRRLELSTSRTLIPNEIPARAAAVNGEQTAAIVGR